MDRIIDMVIGIMWNMFLDFFFFFCLWNFYVNKVVVPTCFLFFFFFFFLMKKIHMFRAFEIRMRLLISSLVRYRYIGNKIEISKTRYRNTNFIARKGVYLSFISFRELWILWNYDRKSRENGIKIEYRSGPIWKSGFCSFASFRWRE